ncbi:hypothetical protein [Cesiribacter andamanensis]|uniref:Lipoprotein n=1 Tax=Cesiribacter andamanensis AMV16 TaxID=1279009 RepID=M7NKR8_9BACT|nr:hypothetical protein [Cesiribacter andamanensis]EMR02380.1 hypothetical protein ADICEAN_02476 [Cesiribacter andamanensis AMV16]
MKHLFSSLLMGLALLSFSACETESEGRVTFYVGNAGSAGVWDHISVQIGGQSDSFFTPESRNMSLSNCEGDAYAATFILPPGKYSYTASNKWSGTVYVEGGDCKIIELQY